MEETDLVRSEMSIVLVEGPYDDQVISIDIQGHGQIVHDFGAQGEVVYRVIPGSDPLRAEFEGFRQR